MSVPTYCILLYFISIPSHLYSTGRVFSYRRDAFHSHLIAIAQTQVNVQLFFFAFNLSDSLLDIHSSYCALIRNFTKNTFIEYVQVCHIHLLLYT